MLAPMLDSPLIEIGAVVACIVLVSVGMAKMDDKAEATPLCKLVGCGMAHTVPLVLFALSALVLPVSARIFSVFSCASVGYDDGQDATRAFLLADLSVECHGTRYRELQALAGALVVIWPLGVFATFAALLVLSRAAAPWAAQLSRAIGFLHAEYTDRCFYWGLFELARTLFLTGFVFLIPFEWSTLRLILALLLSICHVSILLSARPYKQQSTALVAAAASISLLCTLLAALLVRLLDEIQMQAVASSRRTDERMFSTEGVFALTLLILVVNFGLIGVAGTFIVQEARGLAVLRLVANGHTPTLSLVKDKTWHLFISYNWANQVRRSVPCARSLPEPVAPHCPSRRI